MIAQSVGQHTVVVVSAVLAAVVVLTLVGVLTLVALPNKLPGRGSLTVFGGY